MPLDYAVSPVDHSPLDERKLWKGVKKMDPKSGAGNLPRKKKKWIQGAINPSHKGFCTPMTKTTCTPRRKALAMRFKKGGDLHK
jgi:hypothetical protein